MNTIPKLFILVAVLTLATLSHAQMNTISVGVKGGLQISQVNRENHKGRVGYHVGLSLDWHLDTESEEGLSVMSGVEMNTKGGKTKGATYKMEATYLQVPVHVAYRIRLDDEFFAFFSLGPYVGMGMGGKTQTIIDGITLKEDTFGNSDSQLKKLDWGMGLSGGFAMGRIQARLGYDHGFANVARAGASLRNRSAYISIGYLFF